MPFLVKMLIIIAEFLTFCPWRNNRFGFVLFDNELDKIVGIIAFVGNQALKIEVEDQRFRLSDVVTLSSGQNKAERIAQSINTDVNFGTEATFAPA